MYIYYDMKKIIIITSFLSILLAEYNVINAFPNLSFDNPVGIYHAGDNSNRIFVVEQEGRIKVFENNLEVSNSIFLFILAC